MIIVFSWSYLFSDITLEKGKSYYNSVGDVKRIDDKIFAFVKGSVDYYVCVTVKEYQIKSVECNCYNDSNCKHIVALLHYIENNQYLLEDYDEYMDRLYSMDADNLRTLLIRLLEEECSEDKLKHILNEKTVDKNAVLEKLQKFMSREREYYPGVISEVLSFIDCDVHMLYKNGEYDFVAELLNMIFYEYLTGSFDINYNSEDILSDRYLSYSKILLDIDNVSEGNKKIILENVDRINGYY